jgi:NAD(P)-dependent dehydrogenase (short-subunit alcohol dehydrogenase family)
MGTRTQQEGGDPGSLAVSGPATLFALGGKRALVTGASRGIGRAIALTLAGAGADVAIHFHTDRRAAARVADSIRSAGRRVTVLRADLAREGAGRALAKAAEDRMGQIDILVLNAAEQRRAALADITPAEYALQIDTGFRSAVELCAALVPAMAERRFGRVIAIGSVQARRPNPQLAVYAAMKAALANLMRNLGKAWAGYGVTANTIAPGLIDTDRNAELKADGDAYAALLARIPAGRAGTANEVAALALLLAAPAGAYVTGADLAVDGGLGLP